MIRDLWQPALRSLWRKRLRTLLTVSGITVGVMLVVIVSMIGQAGRAAVNAELDDLGLNGLSVTVASGAGGRTALTSQQLQVIRRLDGVEAAAPLMIQYSAVDFHGEPHKVLACGIDSGATQAITLNLLHGRLLTQGDVAAAARVCVVDAETANAMYSRENIVGKSLTVNIGGLQETFCVVGVTEAGSSLLQSLGEIIPGMVYAPYSVMQQLTGRSDFDQIAVRVADGSGSEQVRERIEQVLARQGAYQAENLAAQKAKLSRLMDIVTLILTAISAISLVVSGLGIMTVMLVSVNERTREIGIKKALGATGGRILREFLAESVMISLLGSITGLLIGGGVSVIGLWLFHMTLPLSWGAVLPVCGFAVVLGALFGVYPACKAARLRPVEALRAE